MHVDGHAIGTGRCFIVAELSGNHNGDLDMAKQMVLEAQRCGADAVKVQTLDPFDMPDKDETVKEGVVSKWIGRRWLEVYKATFLPWRDQLRLKEFAMTIGMTFFASVYSKTAVDFWERNGGLPAYKIAAWQQKDPLMFALMIKTGKPFVVSFSDMDGGYWQPGRAAFLAKDDLDLILRLSRSFCEPVGYSNHGEPMQCVEAVKRGAVIVEQHFRIDEGLDLCAALPGEFKAMVEAIRKVERCSG